MNPFVRTITSGDPAIRDTPFEELCHGLSKESLAVYLAELDEFRKTTLNLYEKVRASIFLYAGYRFYLLDPKSTSFSGKVPPEGLRNLFDRNFEKAIGIFHASIKSHGADENVFSSLAECYHENTFQVLADQVRKSVRSSSGNQWMFRVGHPDEHPLKIHPHLLERSSGVLLYPIVHEKTAVRMDLSHSCWSDIFFLGMDYPEGARVINISVNLGIYGRDHEIRPPIETFVRVIAEPVLRLTSLDLRDSKDIATLSDLFNFGNDYLGLLKAAVISSGVIPPSFEGTNYTVRDILERIISPGLGLELVTKVNDIPKGSRLAVSTNLLASAIGALMRATQQTELVDGVLTEQEKKLVASRAILGEWLGGSGGGWQDSGGIWPGAKLIEGVAAREGDTEFSISRGRLLPVHRLLSGEHLHAKFEETIASSLVLLHGGMASNVGPILELVTEKYLLRSKKEWDARRRANGLFDSILASLRSGDVKQLASLTSNNFDGPIKAIIPAATNYFTESVIRQAQERLGAHYWGFLMLGGMSGGGMGIFVDPAVYAEAKQMILEVLQKTKDDSEEFLPFAMDPVVYNFGINKNGSISALLRNSNALMPQEYYSLLVPRLARLQSNQIPDSRKVEIDLFTTGTAKNDQAYPILRSIVGNVFQFSSKVEMFEKQTQDKEAEKIKLENGFDPIQHEQIRSDLIKGRIGLSRNRLPAETIIEDVTPSDVELSDLLKDTGEAGKKAIAEGRVGVFSLAAGVGSRWTTGAGVIKAINPFVAMKGAHRSFLEIHLAKSRKTSADVGGRIPFMVSTSYLTHGPIQKVLRGSGNYGYTGSVYLSRGKSIGQRFIPMERDLRFLWEERLQEKLDVNKQKVIEATRETLIQWARNKGEGNDYTDNVALQRLIPMGHWYEVPNLFRNGVLAAVLKEHPDMEHLLLHNIDTLGVSLSPEILNYHLRSGNALTFEVVPRRIEDRGGGLARINGKVRILEGLAQPREEDEWGLSFYNSMTTWINLEKLLATFGLSRGDLMTRSESELAEAVRTVARHMPTYVTIKDVKYRWGHGQEDVYPVAQIEKLWSDMSAYPGIQCGYVVVSRNRGQQLKDPGQLDAWINDGSKEYVEGLCDLSFGSPRAQPG
ncbi:MAG TPA: UTP--glucose-1-phosphate uridylyltransferase [Bacteroidota bacterium]|nr:UTP--glucose-1-phosphate uridylyltransferase [Bacteroidota bacterium]